MFQLIKKFEKISAQNGSKNWALNDPSLFRGNKCKIKRNLHTELFLRFSFGNCKHKTRFIF